MRLLLFILFFVKLKHDNDASNLPVIADWLFLQVHDLDFLISYFILSYIDFFN